MKRLTAHNDSMGGYEVKGDDGISKERKVAEVAKERNRV